MKEIGMRTSPSTMRRFAIGLIAPCLIASCASSQKPASSDTVQPGGGEMFSEASAYERFMGRWSRLLGPPFVSFCGVRDGDDVLDVGSGTGALSVALVEATKTSHVTGIDPSARYVSYAAQQRASPRLAFEVGDAQRLGFGDAAFDESLALLVFNFIPDRARALTEMMRVTRPGGLVAAAVWEYSDGMKMLRIFWDEAVRGRPARTWLLCRWNVERRWSNGCESACSGTGRITPSNWRGVSGR